MYPHRIRLRGPWDCEPLAWSPPETALPLPSRRRMTMPCRWADGGWPGFRGKARFIRRFGYPGRIDEFERVWLTFAGVTGIAVVWLNGTLLGGIQDADVTRLLQDRNELRVEIDGDDRGGLWGEVALEVRCAAFLRGTQVTVQRISENVFLHLSTEVVGEADGILEVYLILDRSTVAYSVVTAVATGQEFSMVAGPLNQDLWNEGPLIAKIDLVHGPTVWYTVEMPISLVSDTRESAS